jgi:hypothetical protein
VLANTPLSANITGYAYNVLPVLPFLGNLTVLGLDGGSLYDVLPPNPGTGNVTVNATAFNITCGYIAVEDVGTRVTGGAYRWQMNLSNNITFGLASTGKRPPQGVPPKLRKGPLRGVIL